MLSVLFAYRSFLGIIDENRTSGFRGDSEHTHPLFKGILVYITISGGILWDVSKPLLLTFHRYFQGMFSGIIFGDWDVILQCCDFENMRNAFSAPKTYTHGFLIFYFDIYGQYFIISKSHKTREDNDCDGEGKISI